MSSRDNNKRLRSALFVDFDNIYISLEEGSQDVADTFAKEPQRWLKWLAEQAERNEGIERSILLRRCYMNPRTFWWARAYFVNAGFDVVDCPPLTATNKNSGDIYMVIDILDALDHDTSFDEFIIFSSDADFRPVVNRLRSHDRRTTVLVVGQSSPAFRGSCDLIIDETEFLEDALATADPRQSDHAHPETGRNHEQLLEDMAALLGEEVRQKGGVEAADLPGLYRRFPEFASEKNWLGFFGLRPLTEHLARVGGDLVLTGGLNWKVMPAEPAQPARIETSRPTGDLDASRIIESVEQLVRDSEKPVPMATAAAFVRDRFGDAVITSNWLGAGSFKDLLAGRNSSEFEVSGRFRASCGIRNATSCRQKGLQAAPTSMTRRSRHSPVVSTR